MKIDITKTNDKYDILYADPPWAYLWGTGKEGGNFAPEKHYSTMSTAEICELGEYIKKCVLRIVLYLYGQPLAGMGSYTKANAENRIDGYDQYIDIYIKHAKAIM